MEICTHNLICKLLQTLYYLSENDENDIKIISVFCNHDEDSLKRDVVEHIIIYLFDDKTKRLKGIFHYIILCSFKISLNLSFSCNV